MPQAQSSESSPRQRLREFIKAEIDGRSETAIPDLTNRAVKFAIKDRAYLKALLVELLRPIVYAEAIKVVSRTRGPSGLVQLGDEIVKRSVLTERADRLGRKWAGFMEHAGSRHVLLLDMTADDLALAEAERRQRGDIEHGFATLWAKLRTRLEPGQRVRDVWSVQEIEEAFRSIKAA